MKERVKRAYGTVKKGSDNSGSTLVIVLTIVAFLSILAVVVTSAAATNYKMKIINKQSQKAFYTSEDALDEIYAALGIISMETFDEAYNEELASVVRSETVGNSTVSVTVSNLTANKSLREGFTYKLLDKLNLLDESKSENDYTSSEFGLVSYSMDSNPTYVEKFIDVLNSFLEDEGVTDEDNVGLKVVSIDSISVTKQPTSITKDGSTTTLDLNVYTLTFTNCRVEYLNERSYYSNITFDGQIAMPDVYIDFSTETTNELTTFADYALVGNTGIVVGDDTDKGTLNLNGSAYGGGVTVSESSILNVGTGVTLISGDDITVNNGTLNSANADIWCESLVTMGEVGSTVTISGDNSNLYVKDDLQVDGDYSTVTLDGSYYGYSYEGTNTEEGNHNNSSAIIVNGTKSAVNLQALNLLILGGRAYIDYENFSTDKAYTTGESVSLIATQEMYLVPSYMMTRQTTDDEGNITETDVNNPVVDITGVVADITEDNFFGYKYLDESNPYTTKSVTEDSKTLTYYYFNFKDDDAAADYVEALLDDDVYAEITADITDKSVISAYDKCRAYIKSVITANILAQSSDLITTVASGNVYTSGQMISADINSESISLSETSSDYNVTNTVSTDGFVLEELDLSNRYSLLSTILAMPSFTNADSSRNYLYSLGSSVIIDGESINISGYKENAVFENIISMDALSALTATEAHSEVIEIEGYGTGVVSYVTNGATTVISDESGAINSDYGIIVTTGDVIVKKNFTGAIIAKGTITIEGNVTVTSDSALVKELLSLDSALSDILNTQGSTAGAEISVSDMTYKDFVEFINWRKTENETTENATEESDE